MASLSVAALSAIFSVSSTEGAVSSSATFTSGFKVSSEAISFFCSSCSGADAAESAEEGVFSEAGSSLISKGVSVAVLFSGVCSGVFSVFEFSSGTALCVSGSV